MDKNINNNTTHDSDLSSGLQSIGKGYNEPKNIRGFGENKIETTDENVSSHKITKGEYSQEGSSMEAGNLICVEGFSHIGPMRDVGERLEVFQEPLSNRAGFIRYLPLEYKETYADSIDPLKHHLIEEFRYMSAFTEPVSSTIKSKTGERIAPISSPGPSGIINKASVKELKNMKEGSENILIEVNEDLRPENEDLCNPMSMLVVKPDTDPSGRRKIITNIRDRLSIFRGKRPNKSIGKIYCYLRGQEAWEKYKNDVVHNKYLNEKQQMENNSDYLKHMLDQAKKEALGVNMEEKLFGRGLLSLYKDESSYSKKDLDILLQSFVASPLESRASFDKIPIQKFVYKLVEEHSVVMFCESTCLFCLKLQKLFRQCGIYHLVLRLDKMGAYGENINSYLNNIYSSLLPPNVYYHGEHLNFIKTSAFTEQKLPMHALIGSYPNKYDIIAIGSSPAGFEVVFEARRLGVRVCLIDTPMCQLLHPLAVLGRSSLTEPYVSKKILYYLISLRNKAVISNGKYSRSSVNEIIHDWKRLMHSTRSYITKVSLANKSIIHKAGAGYFNCAMKFIDKHTVELTNPSSEKFILRSSFYIMTCNMQHKIPNIKGKEHCFQPERIIDLPHSPGKTLIYGASSAAIEYAGLLGSMGFPVTLMAPVSIMSDYDSDMVKGIIQNMQKYGVVIINDCTLRSVKFIRKSKKGGDHDNIQSSGSDESVYRFKWSPKSRKNPDQIVRKRSGAVESTFDVDNVIKQAILSWGAPAAAVGKIMSNLLAMKRIEEGHSSSSSKKSTKSSKQQSKKKSLKQAERKNKKSLRQTERKSKKSLRQTERKSKKGLKKKGSKKHDGLQSDGVTATDGKNTPKSTTSIISPKLELYSKMVQLFLASTPKEQTEAITYMKKYQYFSLQKKLKNYQVQCGRFYTYNENAGVGVYFIGGTARRPSKRSVFWQNLIKTYRRKTKKQLWPFSFTRPTEEVLACLKNLKTTLNGLRVAAYCTKDISPNEIEGLLVKNIINDYKREEYELHDKFRERWEGKQSTLEESNLSNYTHENEHKDFEDFMVFSLRYMEKAIKRVTIIENDIDYESQCLNLIRFFSGFYMPLRAFDLYIAWRIHDSNIKMKQAKKIYLNPSSALKFVNENFIIKLKCKVIQRTLLDVLSSLDCLLTFIFMSACEELIGVTTEGKSNISKIDIGNFTFRNEKIEFHAGIERKHKNTTSKRMNDQIRRKFQSLKSLKFLFNLRRRCFYFVKKPRRPYFPHLYKTIFWPETFPISKYFKESEQGTGSSSECVMNEDSEPIIQELNSQDQDVNSLFEKSQEIDRLYEKSHRDNKGYLTLDGLGEEKNSRSQFRTKSRAKFKISKLIIASLRRKKIERITKLKKRPEKSITNQEEQHSTDNMIMEENQFQIKENVESLSENAINEKPYTSMPKENKLKCTLKNFIMANCGENYKLRYYLSDRNKLLSYLMEQSDSKPKIIKSMKCKSVNMYREKICRNREGFIENLKDWQLNPPKELKNPLFKFGICDSISERIGLSIERPEYIKSCNDLCSLQILLNNSDLFRKQSDKDVEFQSNILTVIPVKKPISFVSISKSEPEISITAINWKDIKRIRRSSSAASSIEQIDFICNVGFDVPWWSTASDSGTNETSEKGSFTEEYGLGIRNKSCQTSRDFCEDSTDSVNNTDGNKPNANILTEAGSVLSGSFNRHSELDVEENCNTDGISCKTIESNKYSTELNRTYSKKYPKKRENKNIYWRTMTREETKTDGGRKCIKPGKKEKEEVINSCCRQLQRLYSETTQDNLFSGVIPLDGRSQLEHKIKKKLKKIKQEAKSYHDALEDLKKYNILSKIVKLYSMKDQDLYLSESELRVQDEKLFPEHPVYKVTGKYADPSQGYFREHFNTIVIAGNRMVPLEDINFEDIGVSTCHINGKWYTNSIDQTSVPNIYAIGESVYGWTYENDSTIIAARYLVQRLFTNFHKTVEVPFATRHLRTYPHEYAFLGLSEKEAKEKYHKVVTYIGSFGSLQDEIFPMDKAASIIKFVCNEEDIGRERVLGVHLYNEHAYEILQGYTVALQDGLYYHELHDLVAVCPTNPEFFLRIKLKRKEYINEEIKKISQHSDESLKPLAELVSESCLYELSSDPGDYSKEITRILQKSSNFDLQDEKDRGIQIITEESHEKLHTKGKGIANKQDIENDGRRSGRESSRSGVLQLDGSHRPVKLTKKSTARRHRTRTHIRNMAINYAASLRSLRRRAYQGQQRVNMTWNRLGYVHLPRFRLTPRISLIPRRRIRPGIHPHTLSQYVPQDTRMSFARLCHSLYRRESQPHRKGSIQRRTDDASLPIQIERALKELEAMDVEQISSLSRSNSSHNRWDLPRYIWEPPRFSWNPLRFQWIPPRFGRNPPRRLLNQVRTSRKRRILKRLGRGPVKLRLKLFSGPDVFRPIKPTDIRPSPPPPLSSSPPSSPAPSPPPLIFGTDISCSYPTGTNEEPIGCPIIGRELFQIVDEPSVIGNTQPEIVHESPPPEEPTERNNQEVDDALVPEEALEALEFNNAAESQNIGDARPHLYRYDENTENLRRQNWNEQVYGTGDSAIIQQPNRLACEEEIPLEDGDPSSEFSDNSESLENASDIFIDEDAASDGGRLWNINIENPEEGQGGEEGETNSRNEIEDINDGPMEGDENGA